jgi:hypothetical protein
MRVTWVCVALLGSVLAVACGDDETNEGSGGTGGAGGGSTTAAGGAGVIDELTVSGTVIGFDDEAISGSATVTATGLNPPPTISVTGADFEITGVAPFSVFQILSGAPPDYPNHYNVATEVEDADVSGVQARVVSETFLAAMQTEFNVTPAAGTGIIIGHVIADDGSARDAIAGSVFEINGAAPPTSPFFLDAANAPDAALTETSTSGWIVFYDVPAGLAAFTAAGGSGYSIVAAQSPVAANVVTLADITVNDGELVLPVNVSFANDVVPIFSKRGCEVCHSGNSIGADLGQLALNGGANKIYRELAEELSPTHGVTRVNLETPNESLVLTMPSLENPPDAHPNVTFTGTADPDYLTLLGWITEGALEN